MRDLNVTIDDALAERLEEFGREHNLTLEEIVREGIKLYVRSEDIRDGEIPLGTRIYVRHETDQEEFRARIQQHVEDHAWLLNELAKND